MKIEKKAKGKGKAIVGIAMAAIMLASVFVAMVPTAIAVAPWVTVDKVTCGTTLNVPVDYTFTITNNDAFAQTFTINYPAASLTGGWIGTEVPFTTANIPAGGTGTFTLTFIPTLAGDTPINVPVTVTADISGDATTKTIGCYMTPLTYNGLRNVIPAPAGAYDPSNPADPNYIPPNAVLIGQELDLSALPPAQRPATIIGDPTNPATAGEIFTTDAAGMFDAAVMTNPGTYYINPVGGTSTTPPTTCWGILLVTTPTMNLDLRVGGTSVSRIAQGTPLQIRFTNNLSSDDMVTLKIIDLNGDQIKSTTTPVQKFYKINVQLICDVYGVAGIDTTGWSVGTYTFRVKTAKTVADGTGARGLTASSNEKTLTIMKPAIAISAEKTEVPEEEIVRLTVTGVTGHVISIDSSCWEHTVFPGGLDDNPPVDTPPGPVPIVDTIDADGKRTYAVEFFDTGAYMITVTDTSVASQITDTVDITVMPKEVTFDMPVTVALGEKLTLKGVANTGDWVAIAFDNMIPAGYDKLTIGADGEFSKDIATGSASPSNALKAPGSVRVKAFINYDPATNPWHPDTSNLTDDGSTAILLTAELSVSVSTDKTDYQPRDIMETTITMTNTFDTQKVVTLYWWLTIPQFDYMAVMLSQPFILPQDYNTSLIIPVPIGKWGNSAFGAVWGVGFFDKENKIIAWDTTGWNYVPTKVAQVEKSPATIAKEIIKEIEGVELPD